MNSDAKNCNCGREKSYKDCCGRIHLDIKLALTAEDLMRSRYTAFTMANGDYLMQSHHTKTRPSSEKEEIVTWAKKVRWIRLEVLKISKGAVTDKKGRVEFKAYFEEDKKLDVIHENSAFVRENEHWVYLGSV